MYEATGIVTKVGEARAVGLKGRIRREFRIRETPEGRFPNLIPFTLKGENVGLADGLQVGDSVKVQFVLEGHERDKGDGTEPRCYCSNVCLRLERQPSERAKGETLCVQQ